MQRRRYLYYQQLINDMYIDDDIKPIPEPEQDLEPLQNHSNILTLTLNKTQI